MKIQAQSLNRIGTESPGLGIFDPIITWNNYIWLNQKYGISIKYVNYYDDALTRRDGKEDSK